MHFVFRLLHHLVLLPLLPLSDCDVVLLALFSHTSTLSDAVEDDSQVLLQLAAPAQDYDFQGLDYRPQLNKTFFPQVYLENTLLFSKLFVDNRILHEYSKQGCFFCLGSEQNNILPTHAICGLMI